MTLTGANSDPDLIGKGTSPGVSYCPVNLHEVRILIKSWLMGVTSSSGRKSAARNLIKLIGLAALYAVLYKLPLIYFSQAGGGSPIFLASGLALAAILIGGFRYAWSIFLGVLLVHVWDMSDPLGLLGMTAASTLGAMSGACLLKRDGTFDPSLRVLPDFLKLAFFGGVIGSGVSAVIGGNVLLYSGISDAGSYFLNMFYWWSGDLLGVLVVAPLILFWHDTRFPQMDLWRWTEATFIVGLTVLAGQVVFLGWLHDSIGQLASGYWMFLFIVWVAARLNTRGTTVVLLITEIQAALGAHLGLGIFADESGMAHLTNLMFYMLVLTVVGMALSTYISAHRMTMAALRSENEKNQALLRSASDGIHVLDADGYIIEASDSFCTMLGFQREEVVGMHVTRWDARLSAPELTRSIGQLLAQQPRRYQFETLHRRKDGSIFEVEVSSYPIQLNGKQVLFSSSRDITQRKAADEKINQLAFYDHLTGLPNRRLLLDRLQHALASFARSGRKGVLLYIDLNNFRTLNDTLGHVIGDSLLKMVGERLVSCVRADDTVARPGGDEFAVILEDLSDNDLEAATKTESICAKILATLNQPYQLGEHEYQCTISIGGSQFSDSLHSAEELLKQAEIAMYQAKKIDRNMLRYFSPQMQESINARVALENELQRALVNREFCLHYQVQIDSRGCPEGAEALVRWQHPREGLVAPAKFIALAEETGLIIPLGNWMLESACEQLKQWERDVSTRNLVLSVNVSARQFSQTNFVDNLSEIIRRHEIVPGLLELELTESLLLENIDEAIQKMGRLRKLGVRFSLDDFGTGYSSLQYLKRLPLNELKIDQSFVRDIAYNSSDSAIVSTIIAMARSFGLEVIAEGVETEEQRQLLLDKGCTRFQGYLFSKPVPAEQFQSMLLKKVHKHKIFRSRRHSLRPAA